MDEWELLLKEEKKKPYFLELQKFLKEERAQSTVFPAEEEVFFALEKTPFSKVKVVLLGQDPYHGLGQSHGLAFSVKKEVALPPSLKNLFKELSSDLEVEKPSHGCLEKWAESGVLLLNTVLTVKEGSPFSHQNKGWEKFTDVVIELLARRKEPLVFLLLGKKAQEKMTFLKQYQDRHAFILAAHPSPLSYRHFTGSRIFSKVNKSLKQFGYLTLDWSV